MNNDREVVDILLHAGANIDIVNNMGQTYIDILENQNFRFRKNKSIKRRKRTRKSLRKSLRKTRKSLRKSVRKSVRKTRKSLRKAI